MARISKRDRETIGQLVGKYSAKAVAKAAMSVANAPISAAKAASNPVGKPPNYAHNPAFVWVHVEYRRNNSTSRQIKAACISIAKDLRKFTAGPHPAWGTIRSMYYAARTIRTDDASLKQWMDGELINLERNMAAEIKRDPRVFTLPMLLKKTADGGLETPAIDRSGKGGRVRSP